MLDFLIFFDVGFFLLDFGFLVLSLDLEFKGKINCQKKCGHIACKAKLFTFFGPMGLGETLAMSFLLILGVCSRFSRNKRL